MLHFKKFISVSGEFKGWAEQAYLGNLTGKLRFTWAACRQLWIARLLAESVCCQMCPLSQICAPTCAVSGLFTCHAKEPSYNIQRAELKPSDKTFLTQWKLFTAATVHTFHNVFFFFFFLNLSVLHCHVLPCLTKGREPRQAGELNESIFVTVENPSI